MLHSRFQLLSQLKIVLKSALKRIPGPGKIYYFLFYNTTHSISGWAMQHAGYLFLDRIWEKDQQTIKDISGYYKSCQLPFSVRKIFENKCLFDILKE